MVHSAGLATAAAALFVGAVQVTHGVRPEGAMRLDTEDPANKTSGSMVQIGGGLPSVMTWNMGGGSPSADYNGGKWQAPAGFEQAEKNVGAFILGTMFRDAPTEREKKKKDYAWGRYEISGTELGGIWPGFAGVTAAQVLEGMREKAEGKDMVLDTYDCWKDLSMKDILRHAFNKKSPALMPAVDGRCVDEKLKLQATKTFAGPDGCFKKRKASPVFATGFMELVRARRADISAGSADFPSYWEMYLSSILGLEAWGKPSFCSFARTGTPAVEATPGSAAKEEEPNQYGLMDPPRPREVMTNSALEKQPELVQAFVRSSHEGNWIPIALWDTYLIHIVATSLKDGQDQTQVDPFDDHEVEEELIRILRHTAQESDVLLLQETQLQSTEKSGELVDTHIPSSFTGDAQVWVSKTVGVDEGLTEAASAKWASLCASHETPALPLQIPDGADPKKMLSKENCMVKTNLLVTADKLLVVSIHSDSDGYMCAVMLRLVSQLLQQLDGAAGAVVGMDSNVQPKAGVKGYDLKALQEQAAEMGFVQVPFPSAITHTVKKTRSALQAQVTKMGKIDEAKKDLLFTIGINSEPYTAVEVINQPFAGERFDGEKSFPQESFPCDHFIVSAKPP